MEDTNSKFNVTVPLEVELIIEGEGENEKVKMPINMEQFKLILEKYQRKEVRLKVTIPNCNISFINVVQEPIIDDFGINQLGYIIEVQKIANILNTISDYNEIQAFSECYSSDVVDIIKMIKKGKYHFYRNPACDEVIKEIGKSNLDEKTLREEGYFKTSVGLIYIIDKPTKQKLIMKNEMS